MDAPNGVRGLEFCQAADGTAAVCLWEAPSVEAVQGYVDAALGDSSVNTCYQVDSAHAFAERPAGIQEPATFRAHV